METPKGKYSAREGFVVVAALLAVTAFLPMAGCKNDSPPAGPTVIEATEDNFDDALKRAMDAPGSTLMLKGDISVDTPIQVTGGEFTLDLNGYKIAGIDVEVLEVAEGATLTILDGSATGTPGAVNSATLPPENGLADSIGIKNNGILTIIGGNITGGDVGVVNYGILTVTGGNITGGGAGVVNNGTMTVSGGNISGDYNGVQNGTPQDEATLYLSGDPSITGGDYDFNLLSPVTMVGELTGGPYTVAADFPEGSTEMVVVKGGSTSGGDAYKITEADKEKFEFPQQPSGASVSPDWDAGGNIVIKKAEA